MTRRIFFYPDCGPEIGGGHVMRSLTLAEALAARGAVCALAGADLALGIVERYGTGAVEVLAIDGDLAAAEQAADAWDANLVILDNYRLSAAEEARFRRPERRVATTDDLADRPHDVDIVLDPCLGRSPGEYAALTPPGTVLLSGPQYALLRPQFAAARPGALARRGAGPARTGLVSLGLTDVGGVTGRTVELLLPVLGDMRLDVVVGGQAPSLPRLRQISEADARVRLHVETTAMAELIAAADLAVGAGGSSSWERACLGLPSITLILAPNQAPLAQALDREGISIALDVGVLEAALAQTWLALTRDGAALARMSRLGARLCDGAGAGRAAERLLAL